MRLLVKARWDMRAAEMTFGNGALMLGTSTNDIPTPAEHGIYVCG